MSAPLLLLLIPLEILSWARHYAKPFHVSIHLIPHQPCQAGRNACTHFKDEYTEAQSSYVTCPGPHSLQVWGLELELGSLTPEPMLLTLQ